ncbi:CAP domain-containing protein [Streptomyces longispororuber]|uniref:CAP domain-containing protein n=1 Tax=Streptomyces longispororuber TaxID=68230 RepID=UPI0033E2CEB0
MTGAYGKVFLTGWVVLAVLLCCAPPASASARPSAVVTPPRYAAPVRYAAPMRYATPMRYETPPWPVPAAGPWRAPRYAAQPPHSTATGATGATGASGTTAAAAAPTHLVAEVNRHRAAAGCPPVRLREGLSRVAQAHSADMAARGRLSHAGTDGSSPGERVRAAGYHPGRTGETVAAGPDGAAAVVARWMDSPAHRAILLTCDYTDAGVGRATGADGPWWTLDLAAPR